MACVRVFGKLTRFFSRLKYVPPLLLLCGLTFGQTAPPPQLVNLNTATSAQLETLPGIGAGLAARILEHRRKHGPFKRPQELIVVRGFSAKRYRQLAHLLTV
jgi:competence protein ComEA